jgi:hypothetical protein
MTSEPNYSAVVEQVTELHFKCSNYKCKNILKFPRKSFCPCRCPRCDAPLLHLCFRCGGVCGDGEYYLQLDDGIPMCPNCFQLSGLSHWP